jgi:hypothetical protein
MSMGCSLHSPVAQPLPIPFGSFAMAQGKGDADGDPQDEGAARSTAPHDDLPYKVELWNGERTSIEQVLAVTAHGSIGYAAYHAATREHPEARIALRRGNRIVAEKNRRTATGSSARAER